MDEMMQRTGLLVGDEGMERLSEASVILAGVGAVGGYALEGLVRAGIGRIRVVDADVFSGSNLNRQILATVDTVGRPKAEVACERARSINPGIDIEPMRVLVDDSTVDGILDSDFDILVDDPFDPGDHFAHRLRVIPVILSSLERFAADLQQHSPIYRLLHGPRSSCAFREQFPG